MVERKPELVAPRLCTQVRLARALAQGEHIADRCRPWRPRLVRRRGRAQRDHHRGCEEDMSKAVRRRHAAAGCTIAAVYVRIRTRIGERCILERPLDL